MPSFSRALWWIAAVWMAVLGSYAVVGLVLPRGQALTTFGNVTQCIVPLLANAGLLINAGTPHWRRNAFWTLLALGCTLWLLGQFQWAYYEVYLHQPLPAMYPGDIIFFLRGIPMIAALTLQPHLRHGELRTRLGFMDFALLFAWWVFLYAFVVLPWLYAAPTAGLYNFNYILLVNIQNLVLVAGLGWLWLRTRSGWRLVYGHLFGAAATYMLASLALNVTIDEGRYFTGSFYDIPLIASFLWFGTAGLMAYRLGPALSALGPKEGQDWETEGGVETVWPARLAMAAVLSVPLFALWALRSSDLPAVRQFRLVTALIAAVLLTFLVFLRQHLADSERMQLLKRSQESIESLKRLQAQLVQSEKLVSLGQLAAGAAHEINNPLTAILGFSDLLADDAAMPDKARGIADRIREQARRTKSLVSSLLSFARKVPTERTLLDINTVVMNAVQLRRLDLRGTAVNIETQLESVLPGVRGDANQLMQVFFNLISNAVDAMEQTGGRLTIRTMRDRANVVILFADTGPGIREPHRVFDPFYTTKPVGKGTGLGLSICYGLIQEHGGQITCYNRAEGGAVFRVELPALLVALPTREARTPPPVAAASRREP
jgi:signal transduction histidine kinase